MNIKYVHVVSAFFLVGCWSQSKQENDSVVIRPDLSGAWAIQSHASFYKKETGEFLYSFDNLSTLIVEQVESEIRITKCENYGKDQEAWRITDSGLEINQYVTPYTLREDGSYEQHFVEEDSIIPGVKSEWNQIMYQLSGSSTVDQGFFYLEGPVAVNEDLRICVVQGVSVEHDSKEVDIYAHFLNDEVYLQVLMQGEISESHYSYEYGDLNTPFRIDVNSFRGGITNNHLGPHDVDISITEFSLDALQIDFSFISQFDDEYYGSARAELLAPRYKFQSQRWVK